MDVSQPLRPRVQKLPLPFHRQLREDTRVDHDMVDGRFGQFDLGDRAAYTRFLTAHAIVLPALERQLPIAEMIDAWEERSTALLSDLAALDAPAPASMPIGIANDIASRWGATYVVEGSRLGGIMLARQIKEGLPSAYLNAAHKPAQWKRFLSALDDAAKDAQWRAAAVGSAKNVFAAYAAAADIARADR